MSEVDFLEHGDHDRKALPGNDSDIMTIRFGELRYRGVGQGGFAGVL